MGSLAIDIETASPFKEPQHKDFRNTDYFELEGWHIGTTWGEQYVQWIEAGLQEQKSFIELQRLIEDYATADVRPLYELHTALSQEA